MAKAGRRRRTPEQRLAARENRSTLGFLELVQRKVIREERIRMLAEYETADDKLVTPVSPI